MPRLSLYRSPPLACAALLALAAPAFAQSGTDTTTTPAAATGTLTAHAISVGSNEVKLDDIVQVGIAACNDDAEIKIEIDGVPADKSIDIYTGTGCNDKSRDTKTDTTASNCDFIDNAPMGPSKGFMVSLHAKQLISDCSKDADDTKTLWFVAVSSSQASEPGTTYGVIEKVHLDTRRPAAPTAVKGGSGESEIPIEWNVTGSDLDSFIVLIDSDPTDGMSSSGTSGSGSSMADEDGGTASGKGGNASNGECGSSELTPGSLDSGVSTRIVRKKIGESTATGVKLKPSDIGGGDGSSAAIAVVAVDLAGNESLISEIACVKVVPTEGFWDRYQSDPNAVDAGCPCTAMGRAQLESAWPIALSLALCGLSARRRRRRS